MKQALLVLLFHKLVTLQPAPLDVPVEAMFKPSVEISAITNDARLIVDVTNTLGALGQAEKRKRAREMFPIGSVWAEARGPQAPGSIRFEFRGGMHHSGDSTALLLTMDAAAPLNVVFDQVVVRTRVPLTKATVQWENSKW